jgi:hypothetical protein
MLAHLGVLAYFGWKFSWVGLLLLAPVCWFLPIRFAWIYLGLIACNRLIWWVVLSQLENHAWFQFAVGTLVFIPVVATVLVSIARKSKIQVSAKIAAFAVMFAAPPAVTMLLAPYWFDAVHAKFVESAKQSAGGRLSCLFKYVEGGLPQTELSVRKLLLESTSYRGEYPGFYALLVIDNGSEVEYRYWSFGALAFIDVPATFEMSRLQPPCKPAPDPFAAMAIPE